MNLPPECCGCTRHQPQCHGVDHSWLLWYFDSAANSTTSQTRGCILKLPSITGLLFRGGFPPPSGRGGAVAIKCGRRSDYWEKLRSYALLKGNASGWRQRPGAITGWLAQRRVEHGMVACRNMMGSRGGYHVETSRPKREIYSRVSRLEAQ